MKISTATNKEQDWADRLEGGSNISRTMVMRLRGHKVAVRVMVPLHHDDVLEEACGLLRFAVVGEKI